MTYDLCFALYNSSQWLTACVEAIAAVNYDCRKIALYFADNASQDDSLAAAYALAEKYRDVFREIRVLPQKENLGFGSASNAAARAGNGDFVFFCNVDTEIDPDAFQNLDRAIEQAPADFGAFELRQFPYEHPKYYDPVTLETSWCSGACFVLRREVFEKTGGFDESIFMYAEDVDLSWHIRALGYKLMYVPSAVIHHYAYRTAGEEKPTQLAGSVAGNLVLRYKYGDGQDLHSWKKLYRLVEERIENNEQTHAVFHKQMARIQDHKEAYREFQKNVVCPSRFRPSFLEFDYEFAKQGAFYESHFPAGQPDITVIIRTYRRPELLRMTLESLCNQTYRHFKVLVVEDGENPVSESAVRAFQDRLDLEYIPACASLGRCRAGNVGLEKATTEYVCFLDDDDYFFADHLEVMACLIEENPDCSFFAAGYVEGLCEADPDDLTKFVYREKRNHSGDLRLVDFFSRNPVPIQAVLFRRSLFLEYGGFDETLDELEDWDLWMRYLTHASFACADKATSIYKVPADQKLFAQRDRFIGQYRAQVFEKMASYKGVVTAQDVYGLFWQPDETPVKRSRTDEEKAQEMEKLRAAAKEIRASSTWRATLPLRLLPHIVRGIVGLLGGIVLIVLRFFSFVFEKGTDGVRWCLDKVGNLCNRVGPPAPNPDKATEEELSLFIQLSRRSLCWKLIHRGRR